MEESLPDIKELISINTWNRRYREFEKLVHKGPAARNLLVEAFKYIRLIKDLSYGERKLEDLALNYEKHKAEHEAKVIKLESFKKAKLT